MRKEIRRRETAQAELGNRKAQTEGDLRTATESRKLEVEVVTRKEGREEAEIQREDYEVRNVDNPENVAVHENKTAAPTKVGAVTNEQPELLPDVLGSPLSEGSISSEDDTEEEVETAIEHSDLDFPHEEISSNDMFSNRSSRSSATVTIIDI
ncbi:unnamed protein product [Anisakis simplex]|uniref:Uncharacterized protein n=1 Tax=Anisakis simplex TaxID=6269 RepID=A0A0M3KCY6_ANISI|nr:unnamed protein product [Anisakis simplex]